MMKIKAYIFLFTLIAALFIAKEENNASYYSKRDFYHLALKDDNTFLLTYRIGYLLRYTWGSWERVGKEYHLKGAFNDLNSIPIQVNETKVENEDSITFVLSNNATSVYSRNRIQLLLDSIPFILNENVLKIHSHYKFSEIRLKQYFDYSDIDSGYVVAPYLLHDEVDSQVYSVNSYESNYFIIQWNIDGKIYNYEPIERITLKKRFNTLFWVEKNMTFFKSRRKW